MLTPLLLSVLLGVCIYSFILSFTGYMKRSRYEPMMYVHQVEPEQDEFSDFDMEYLNKSYQHEVHSYSLIEGEKAILSGFDEDSQEYIFRFYEGELRGKEYRVVTLDGIEPLNYEYKTVIPNETLD